MDDNPVFTRHFRAPFTWTTMEWPRTKPYQYCSVSIQLAELFGWRKGFDLAMGPIRLRITYYDVNRGILECYRDSSEREERIRGAIHRVTELATSALRYYFGKKPYYG